MDDRTLHTVLCATIFGSLVAGIVFYFALVFPFPQNYSAPHPPSDQKAETEIARGQAHIERELLLLQKEIEARAEATGG